MFVRTTAYTAGDLGSKITFFHTVKTVVLLVLQEQGESMLREVWVCQKELPLPDLYNARDMPHWPDFSLLFLTDRCTQQSTEASFVWPLNFLIADMFCGPVS